MKFLISQVTGLPNLYRIAWALSSACLPSVIIILYSFIISKLCFRSRFLTFSKFSLMVSSVSFHLPQKVHPVVKNRHAFMLSPWGIKVFSRIVIWWLFICFLWRGSTLLIGKIPSIANGQE
jgi:hypothetical protein